MWSYEDLKQSTGIKLVYRPNLATSDQYVLTRVEVILHGRCSIFYLPLSHMIPEDMTKIATTIIASITINTRDHCVHHFFIIITATTTLAQSLFYYQSHHLLRIFPLYFTVTTITFLCFRNYSICLI